MLLWASLLVLAPVSGQLAAPKPVISLHPPWTVVFRGETVTLTCHVSHLRAAEYITWHLSYLGKDLLHKTPGNTLKVRDSGRFRCQTKDSPPSDSVMLIFSSDWLILQAPHTVFEGDTLVLRCQVKGRQKLITAKYSWNGKVISVSNQGQDLLIPQASLNNSGHYQCIGFLERDHYVYKSSTRIIKIQELFPYPKLRVTPSQPTEGSSVNLSCQTQLPLERSDTLLYFTFFRDRGVMLSDWSRSPELQITTIWREDSGSYWCTAATAIPSIQKHSPPLQVHVQGVPVSGVLLETQPQGGQALAGEPLVLVCSVAEGTGDIAFSWHREDTGEHLGRKQQRSQRAELEIPAVGESHMGRYYCTADNGHGLACSGALNITVTVPASRPVLTLRVPGTQAVVGDVMELHCEAYKGSPPILYRFYHDDVFLGSSSAASGGRASFNLSLTPEHSGSYACEADNGLGAQRSDTASLRVTVPASRPVLTLRVPGTQAVVGDVMELHCEAHRGSPPILYRFYYDDVFLGSSSAPSGGRASFNLSLTPEHSGSYACEADNGLGAQRSEVVPLNVTVPASRPILTLRAPGAQAFPGDVMELHCEAHRGSPPILYRFYHDNVILGSSSVPSGGGASFNLSLTAEHTGNYSCEADNGLGAQCSEAVTLSISGGRTSDPSRNPSNSDPQDPTYYNVPGWIELQPVYSNVNPKGGDVVYSEVRRIQEGNKQAVASDSALRLLWTYLPSHGPIASPQPYSAQGSSVIYSQVKVQSFLTSTAESAHTPCTPSNPGGQRH
uniref:Fc receptor-like protein 5 n=1 Tax=Nyctereutes procyonoides TaxID=34880 RepID=UPI0024438EA6|nr:Fc receptor-like protein 5 [Nyctereutes procyonoides]